MTWVDRFGNCQLNLGPEDVEEWGDELIPLLRKGAAERAERSLRLAVPA